MPRMTLAILSALPEEQQGVIDLLTDPPSGSPHARQHIRCGGRDERDELHAQGGTAFAGWIRCVGF